MKKLVYCPTQDFTCPYCDANGVCMLDNPKRECDDYYAMIGDDEED